MANHKKTLHDIFTDPVKADVEFNDFCKLVNHLGGEQKEGKGSRVRFKLNTRKMVFHKPHPNKEMCKGAVKSARDFLTGAGISMNTLDD